MQGDTDAGKGREHPPINNKRVGMLTSFFFLFPTYLRSGQPRFRSMWERYCRGVSAILFVVDSAVPLPASSSSSSGKDGPNSAPGNDISPSNPWSIATEELHSLMNRPQLAGIPLLVLATKNDVKGAVSAEEVIREM
jgi:ADP-ribosylation factor-like protein 8